MIVDPHANSICCQMPVGIHGRTVKASDTSDNSGCRPNCGEVKMQVFRFHAPLVRPGVFDAGTNHRADIV